MISSVTQIKLWKSATDEKLLFCSHRQSTDVKNSKYVLRKRRKSHTTRCHTTLYQKIKENLVMQMFCNLAVQLRTMFSHTWASKVWGMRTSTMWRKRNVKLKDRSTHVLFSTIIYWLQCTQNRSIETHNQHRFGRLSSTTTTLILSDLYYVLLKK